MMFQLLFGSGIQEDNFDCLIWLLNLLFPLVEENTGMDILWLHPVAATSNYWTDSADHMIR